jgi:hypothetical protein
MILTPTASIRACDMLGRDLLAGYHPLAMALVLCSGEDRAGTVRRILLDHAHPVRPRYLHEDALERAAADDYHDRLEAALAAAVEKAGLSVAALTAPPTLHDLKAVAYCPRCDGEFIIAEGVCTTCGGLALRPVRPAEVPAAVG